MRNITLVINAPFVEKIWDEGGVLSAAFCLHYIRGPVSLTTFARNSNSVEISPCCNSVAGHQIATNFCSDHFIRIEMRVKRNCHRIWIAMEKPLVKLGPASIVIKIRFIWRCSYIYMTVRPFYRFTPFIVKRYSVAMVDVLYKGLNRK